MRVQNHDANIKTTSESSTGQIQKRFAQDLLRMLDCKQKANGGEHLSGCFSNVLVCSAQLCFCLYFMVMHAIEFNF